MDSVPVRLRNVLPPAVRGGDAGAAAKVNVPLPSVGVVADAGWASSAAATTIARSAAVKVRTRSAKREFLPTIDVSSPQMLSDEAQDTTPQHPCVNHRGAPSARLVWFWRPRRDAAPREEGRVRHRLAARLGSGDSLAGDARPDR